MKNSLHFYVFPHSSQVGEVFIVECETINQCLETTALDAAFKDV